MPQFDMISNYYILQLFFLFFFLFYVFFSLTLNSLYKFIFVTKIIKEQEDSVNKILKHLHVLVKLKKL